jgi:hypothetical protein
MPRIARFILQSFQVVGFDSCPKIVKILAPAAVGLDELLRLHEHPARAAAGVVDTPLVRLDHLDQELDDRLRRVELAPGLPLGAGELAQEVLVDPAEDVLRAMVLALVEQAPLVPLDEFDRADQVDQVA